jgi:hypothetical protein
LERNKKNNKIQQIVAKTNKVAKIKFKFSKNPFKLYIKILRYSTKLVLYVLIMILISYCPAAIIGSIGHALIHGKKIIQNVPFAESK